MTPAPELWAAPYLASAVLLVAAGVAKLWRPDATGRALAQAGLPGRAAVVRAGAAAEVAIGCWAAGPSRTAAAALAVSYLAFAGFVALALHRGLPISSCGCFGRADAPPTGGHLAVTASAAALGAWAATRDHAGAVDLLADQPLAGLPMTILVGSIVYMTYLVVAVMPRTAAAGSRGR